MCIHICIYMYVCVYIYIYIHKRQHMTTSHAETRRTELRRGELSAGFPCARFSFLFIFLVFFCINLCVKSVIYMFISLRLYHLGHGSFSSPKSCYDAQTLPRGLERRDLEGLDENILCERERIPCARVFLYLVTALMSQLLGILQSKMLRHSPNLEVEVPNISSVHQIWTSSQLEPTISLLQGFPFRRPAGLQNAVQRQTNMPSPPINSFPIKSP